MVFSDKLAQKNGFLKIGMVSALYYAVAIGHLIWGVAIKIL